MSRQLASRKIRLSLAWKAILLPSIILTFVFLGVSLMLETHLQQSFENARERAREATTQQLRRVLEDATTRMLETVELLPALQGMAAAIRGHDRAAVAEQLTAHWPFLQFDRGLSQIQIYDDRAELFTRVGYVKNDAIWQTKLAPHLQRAHRDEAPQTVIDCAEDCFHIVISPLLIDGRHAGTVLVARPLIESILEFQNIITPDIGILINPNDTDSKTHLPRRIVPLLMAFERRAADLKLIANALSDLPDWPDAHTPFRAQTGTTVREAYLIPLQFDEHDTNDHLVLIDDISRDLQDVQRVVYGTRMATIAGIAIAILTLLAVLWRPTSRLRAAANALPLIPQRQYEQARAHLNAVSRSSLIHDEIDTLTATILDVTDELESLLTVIRTQMDDLACERDFAENLLDTIEIIILTLDDEGRIVSVNRHGEKAIGQSEAELKGMFLDDLLSEPEAENMIATVLDVLSGSDPRPIQHEALLTATGKIDRHVVWAHSRIGKMARNGAVILSAGLDITEHREAQERMSWLNDHDALTALINRRRSEAAIQAAIQDALDNDRHGALLLLDVDNFKDINDTSGHETGDRLLRLIADALRAWLETNPISRSATLGRVGGDEFIMLLPDIGKVDAMYTAERLLETLNSLRVQGAAANHPVMVSAGITLFPEHGADAHELLSHADMAMTHAKASGRGQWHLFSLRDDIHNDIADRVYWRERIDHALTHERFKLYFQPMLALADNQIHHYEVLLRMLDENDAIVPPDKFIPIAERSGLISRIDRFVIEHALRQHMQLSAKHPNLTLSINLSAKAFEDAILTDVLAATIARYNVDPAHLIFELTETAALADTVNARKLMDRLRNIGCLFALDDFGVGFTSFHYLTELPVDIVKIDGAFVRGISQNRTSQLIVEALVGVSNGLGITTIAEFVESAETLETLRSLGVNMAQGFHIGRPQPYLLTEPAALN